MSTPNTYDLGDVIRLSAPFDVDSTPTDPSAVVLTLKAPDGTLTSYIYGQPDAVVVKDSTGRYHADVAPDQSGWWWYGWVGTGTAAAAQELAFLVRQRETA